MADGTSGSDGWVVSENCERRDSLDWAVTQMEEKLRNLEPAVMVRPLREFFRLCILSRSALTNLLPDQTEALDFMTSHGVPGTESLQSALPRGHDVYSLPRDRLADLADAVFDVLGPRELSEIRLAQVVAVLELTRA